MNILLTGNKGYIGTVLCDILIKKSYKVIGYDIDYYSDCYLDDFTKPTRQIIKDTRDIGIEDLDGIDVIIHLAALSNDPLGELHPDLTKEINYDATIKIAKLAKKVGVKRFVYASSQSMYGVSNTTDELDEDNSEKNPVTTYARTKWEAEKELKKISTDDFLVVCFRPSTVFGESPKLRCDIVYNNFVANAFTTGKIVIKSDGTPWRPVVHVKDVCKAFIAGIEAPKELVANQSYNVGISNGNYTVRELAEAAQRVVLGSTLTFTNEHNDSRTYKVSFKKILSELKDYFKPEYDLIRGGSELIEFFNKINFNSDVFNGRKVNRLRQLQYLIKKGEINKDLRRF